MDPKDPLKIWIIVHEEFTQTAKYTYILLIVLPFLLDIIHDKIYFRLHEYHVTKNKGIVLITEI